MSNRWTDLAATIEMSSPPERYASYGRGGFGNMRTVNRSH